MKGKTGKEINYTKIHHFDSAKDMFLQKGDDLFTIMPRLDIKDKVLMMGDYYSTDFD